MSLGFSGFTTLSGLRRPGKNAALYGKVLDWAERCTVTGQAPAEGQMAGVRHSQSSWYAVGASQERSFVRGAVTGCCAAGAAVIMSGGYFTMPQPHDEGRVLVYSRCTVPGYEPHMPIGDVAARLLGLSHTEAAYVFSQFRQVGELSALRRCFTDDIAITDDILRAARADMVHGLTAEAIMRLLADGPVAMPVFTSPPAAQEFQLLAAPQPVLSAV